VRPAVESNRNGKIKNAREQPRDVCFDNRDRLIQGKGRNCVGGVAADARQFPYQLNFARENSIMPSDDHFRGDVQIARSRVVTKALPCV
jgi:hypothetical protein